MTTLVDDTLHLGYIFATGEGDDTTTDYLETEEESDTTYKPVDPRHVPQEDRFGLGLVGDSEDESEEEPGSDDLLEESEEDELDGFGEESEDNY
ncbi:MAG TPA: hypothetical protein VGE63_01660 [Candidatus Paceibacterota bacterium]